MDITKGGTLAEAPRIEFEEPKAKASSRDAVGNEREGNEEKVYPHELSQRGPGEPLPKQFHGVFKCQNAYVDSVFTNNVILHMP